MEPIQSQTLQTALDKFLSQEVYLHLETTNGAYAANGPGQAMAICAYIRNGRVLFHRGVVTGNGPFRVGLKMEDGWIYAEGLTDWEVTDRNELLMAGHDGEGRLAIALQLSLTPFRM